MISWVLGVLFVLGIVGLFVRRKLYRDEQKKRLKAVGAYKGQRVVITGASSGIGEEMAYRYARGGAKILICARRQEEMDRVKQECHQTYNNSQVFTCVTDVSKQSDCEQMVAEAVKVLGGIDILVLNAGMTSLIRFKDIPDLNGHKKLMDINYWGAVYPTYYALPVMKKQNNGTIVVISSTTGKIGTIYRSGYAASKHALHGFFDALRLELVEEGFPIQVTIACPGFVKTNIHKAALGSSADNLTRDFSQFMSVEECVDRVLGAIEDGRFEFMVDTLGVIAKYVSPFFPQFLHDRIRIRKTLAAVTTDKKTD